jgi:hypothetical protein
LIQYSIAKKLTFENGPTVLVKVYLVAVVPRTFVPLSQFLNRKVHVPRLVVLQFQTVIHRVAFGVPEPPLATVVMLKVQVPAGMVALPRVVLYTQAYPERVDVEGVPVVVELMSGSIWYSPAVWWICWLVVVSAAPAVRLRFSHLPLQEPIVELPR